MDYMDLYRKQFNAQLFPLKKFKLGDPDSKRPLESEYQFKEYSDEELREYVRNGHSIGWRLGPNDIVLDLDVATADRPGKKGDQVRPMLENLLGSALTTAIAESPNGGKHYYLRLPEGIDSTSIRTKIQELLSVDILRFRQYVVIAGSPHWQGGHYDFSAETKMFGDYERSEVNEAILQLLRRDPKIESPEIEAATINVSLLDDMLGCLLATDFRDHADWFAMMAASHHATGGSDEGLESFLHWSLSDANYADDREKISKRWRSLDPHKTRGYSVGTIFHELRRAGREDVITNARLRMDFGDQPVDPSPGPNASAIDSSALDPPKPRPVDERTKIEKSPDDKSVNDKFIAELAKRPEIFARLDQLMYVSAHGNKLHQRQLEGVSIIEELSHISRYGEYKGLLKKWVDKSIPGRNGVQIEKRQAWDGVKILRRVTPMPIMTDSGIHQLPGYEPTTGLFYHSPDMLSIPRVPRSPSREQAQEALSDLIDLIAEFPFAEPCHRSAWLTTLFGVVARPLLGPCAPMTLIDGNRSGAGKGMLCDLISDICLAPGDNAAKFTGLDKNEDEQRKMFLALARENPIIGVFDNFRSDESIGSPVLDAILTTGSVSGRLLGLTKIVSATFDSVLIATGNRLQIDANSDLLRRILYVSLQTPSENPEQRTFKYPDIRAHAKQNRGKYLADVLTIMEYSRINIDSLPTVTPWGSYTGYDLIRRVLVDLGEPDPRDSVARLKTVVGGNRELGLVIACLKLLGANSFETSVTSHYIAEKLEKVDDFDASANREMLQEFQALLIPVNSKRSRSGAIGNSLKRYKEQNFNGEWIFCKENSRNSMVWWVGKAPELG